MNNVNHAARNIIRFCVNVVAITALYLLFTGCCVQPAPFELLDNKHTVKSGSLAVLGGTKSKLDILLAKSVTNELRRQGRIKVMSQSDVASKLPDYPAVFIQAANDSTGQERRVSKMLVESAQKRLKTTYLLVVWTEGLTKITKTYYYAPIQSSYTVDIEGSFLEYPGGTLTGRANFRSERTGAMFESGAEVEDIEEMIKEAGKQLSDSFLNAVKQ